MSIYQPDITSETRASRIRAAFTAALLLSLAALFVLLAAMPSEAATRKKSSPVVEPTSVSVASTTCTQLADGTYDVTVTFKVTGGRYLNLGHPSTSAAITNAHGSVHYDNVRGGGSRFIEANMHHLAYPGYDDDHTIAVTDTFTYQHMIAAVTAQGTPVNSRTKRLLSRDFEVTYTCP